VSPLPPLPVAIPLVVAALLTAAGPLVRRRLLDAVSTATAVAVAVLCGILLARSAGGLVLHWFGGWTPRRGLAVGIDLAVDPFGAGMALLAAALSAGALVFAWRYFETTGPLFHVLMLVLLAAMAGFSLTGDLFNMFVFFELMGVAAYALTGYRIEARGPLQGSLNFAVTNSLGGFLVLIGIALVYGRTGALNLAQIGEALAGEPADGLVVASLTLLVAGFLVKAAAVPFHFWLADAYTVPPTPVGVIFAGALSEFGLLGLARVYWTAFSGVEGAEAIRSVLLAFGVATAVVGSVMAFAQFHLKRMLAFVTVAHSGLLLIGLGLLETGALAGAAIYLAADGAVKATLFICVGILLHRLRSVDEDELLGRGRRLPYTGAVFLLAGLGLAGLPPFGTALGKTLMEHEAAAAGVGWLTVVFVGTAVVTAGAVLRAGARIFLGLGHEEPGETPAEVAADEEPETRGPRNRTPPVLLVPAIALLAGGLSLGLVPRLAERAEVAAARFRDRPAYAGAVLEGVPEPLPAEAEPFRWDPGALALGVGGAAGAALLALGSLYRDRAPRGIRRATTATLGAGVRAVKRVHSGHVGDYTAWLTLGTAALGGALALVLR
jgi:multicomponent Na+:H+ antiporter subunit D